MPAWIVWTLLTVLSWGLWAVCPRMMDPSVSGAQQQAISTVGILPIIAALVFMGSPPVSGGVPRRGFWLALGSGVLSGIGNVATYAAMQNGKAATIIPLTSLWPVVTVLLAIPLLSERLDFIQWAGVVASLVAIYLFNVPATSTGETAGSSVWMLLPLAAVVLWGITALMQKAATLHISAQAAALWFLVAFVPLAGVLLLMDPLTKTVDLCSWIAAIVMGFTLGFGNLTILLAFASGGKASIISPLSGLYPLISIPIAIVGFNERLGARELSGVAVALAAVVMLSPRGEEAVAPPSSH